MPFLSRIELAAKQEGILETAREVVLEVLETRFEVVPTQLSEVLNDIEDVSVLKRLHRQSIAIPSIEEFQQLLEQMPVSEEDIVNEN